MPERGSFREGIQLKRVRERTDPSRSQRTEELRSSGNNRRTLSHITYVDVLHTAARWGPYVVMMFQAARRPLESTRNKAKGKHAGGTRARAHDFPYFSHF